MKSLLLIPALLAAQASAITITFTNRCSYTIWPALGRAPWGAVDPSVAWGDVLPSGQTKSVSVDSNLTGIRAWGRTGCDGSGANCATGRCNGGLVCNDAGITAAALFAEEGYADFGQWGGLRTSWDLSYVGGSINIPIRLSAADGQSVTCVPGNCPKNQAWQTNDDGGVADRNSALGTGLTVTFCP
ncbi:Osmotin thaumatin-like protein [Atractiella rhizophila]|nr:Osmotin thaumatin-like protein [Atractiella rhizophila]